MNTVELRAVSRPAEIRREHKSDTVRQFVIDGQTIEQHLRQIAAHHGLDWFRDVVLPTGGDSTCLFPWDEPLGVVGGPFERGYIDSLLCEGKPWFNGQRSGLLFCGYCYDPAFHLAITARVECGRGRVIWSEFGFQYSYERSPVELEQVFSGLRFEFESERYRTLFQGERRKLAV